MSLLSTSHLLTGKNYGNIIASICPHTMQANELIQQIPTDYRWRVEAAIQPRGQEDFFARLQPTLDAITAVHAATMKILADN